MRYIIDALVPFFVIVLSSIPFILQDRKFLKIAIVATALICICLSTVQTVVKWNFDEESKKQVEQVKLVFLKKLRVIETKMDNIETKIDNLVKINKLTPQVANEIKAILPVRTIEQAKHELAIKQYYDKQHNLHWAQPNIGASTWYDAYAFSQNNIASGWELPTSSQAKLLMNNEQALREIGIEKSFYWTINQDNNKATTFNPYADTFEQNRKGALNYVILVRQN